MEKITRLALLQPNGFSIEIKIITDVIFEGEVIKTLNHRTALSPDTDIASTLALVNSHLVELGRPELSNDNINSIIAFADSYYTEALRTEWENRPVENIA